MKCRIMLSIWLGVSCIQRVNWKEKLEMVALQIGKTINVLKFWTLIACQTVQTQIILFLKEQSDQGFLCLLFWQAFIFNTSPDNQLCFWEQKEKSSKFWTFTCTKMCIYLDYNDYLLYIIYILLALQVFISWYSVCMLRIYAFFNMILINKF